MEPIRKPPQHKVRMMSPLHSGKRDGESGERTSIDRLSDVVDRLYTSEYRAARKFIHKRLRQKEMGSRAKKPPPVPENETLYYRILAFRNGKGGGSQASLPNAEPPSSRSKQPNSRSAPDRRPSQSNRRSPEKSNRSQRTPEKTPPNQRDEIEVSKEPTSRPRSRKSRKYEVQNSPSPYRSRREARSPYDRTGSKSSFESVDLPPLEDDVDSINPTPKPTKQDRIYHESPKKRYKNSPEAAKPVEPTTARDVYVEMGDEDRDSPKPRSSRSRHQDDLPPVRESTPNRVDRPLTRGNSDLNRNRVVPPIRQDDDYYDSRHSTPNRDSRRNTPDDRNSRRNTPDDRNSRRNTPDDRNSRRNTPDDRDSRRNTPDDRDSRRNTPDYRDSRRNSPDNRSDRQGSRGSDGARASVLSPRTPRREEPYSSSRDEPVRRDEPRDSNRGNPRDDYDDDYDDDPRDQDNDYDDYPDSPEPEIPRRARKSREEDGRIAALDRLADYNLKTLAGQDAGDAPHVDDNIMKEVFSPEFQRDLDNFLKT